MLEICLAQSRRSTKSKFKHYDIEIPEFYNFLEEYPQCDFGPITQECGCCYAYGPLKALSHRFCRQTDRQLLLSAQYIVACDMLNLGCDGGCSRSAFTFLEQHGVTDRECHPWNKVTKFSEKFCSKCQDGSEPHLYKTEYGSMRQLTTPEEIKEEIYLRGPVTASVAPNTEMRYWKGGKIYTRVVTNTSEPAGHTVELIGWGKEDQNDYWILLNQYGNEWGENGTMKIRMGYNDALVESFVYAADPLIE